MSSEKPAFCADGKKQIWRRLCGKWTQALDVGAIANGTHVCCGSLPQPCRKSGLTCSEKANCLVPSCSQEEWYLRSVEADADHAFRMFGKDTSEFRNCSFSTQSLPCAQRDARFATSELTDAALATLLNLNAEALEATAWEVLQEIAAVAGSKVAFTEFGEAVTAEVRERALFSRRSVVDMTDVHVIGTGPSKRRSLDNTANGKRKL